MSSTKKIFFKNVQQLFLYASEATCFLRWAGTVCLAFVFGLDAEVFSCVFSFSSDFFCLDALLREKEVATFGIRLDAEEDANVSKK